MTNERNNVESIVDSYPKNRRSLKGILLDILEKQGTISKEAVLTVSDRLDISVSEVQSLASYCEGLDGSNHKKSKHRGSPGLALWTEHQCKKWKPDSD